MNKEKILDYHKGGKIGTEIKKKFEKEDLAVAYTPGVAVPCLEIVKNSAKAYEFTNKGNSVAVVTNGSSVLGLGNIGALASKPVMEGKVMIFKKFADIDAVDVLVDTQNIDEFVNAVKLISSGYGGINLEDIKAPECFEIEAKLKKELDIPVFHDDQHGTAIVVGAGLLNALEIANKKIEDVKIVFSGAGAAGIACARLIKKLGAKKENIFMVDSRGVICEDRECSVHKKEFATREKVGKLEEAIDGADVFIGVSKSGILNDEMLLSMNATPIVFALANPNPEILPEIAKRIRDDVIIATGRSDYSNQINNALVFPFIFRGALDSRAKEISEEMKIAAAREIAQIAREDEKFGREFIIPSIFDKRLRERIPRVVAELVK